MKAVTIVIASVFGLLSSYVSADDFRVIDMGYKNIHKGYSPWMKMINNQLEWEIFYQELLEANEIGRLDYCGIGPSDEAYCVEPPPIPTVDFETHQVIIGGVGYRPVEERLVVSNVQTLSDHRMITAVHLKYTEFDGPTVPPTLNDDTLLVIEIPRSDLPISATLETALFLR